MLKGAIADLYHYYDYYYDDDDHYYYHYYYEILVTPGLKPFTLLQGLPDNFST